MVLEVSWVREWALASIMASTMASTPARAIRRAAPNPHLTIPTASTEPHLCSPQTNLLQSGIWVVVDFLPLPTSSTSPLVWAHRLGTLRSVAYEYRIRPPLTSTGP